MRLVRYTAFFLSLSMLAACSPQASSEPKGAAAQVRESMNQWSETVATNSPEKMEKYYQDDAVIVSPFEKNAVKGENQRMEFFRELFAKHKVLKVLPEEQRVEVSGDTAESRGTFTYGYQQGRKWVTVPVRYSFNYKRTLRGWMITNENVTRLGKGKKVG